MSIMVFEACVNNNNNNNNSNKSNDNDISDSVQVSHTDHNTQHNTDHNTKTVTGVGWKKLSTTTKMRSYRDGKPKHQHILFREREVPKKVINSGSSSGNSGKLQSKSKSANSSTNSSGNKLAKDVNCKDNCRNRRHDKSDKCAHCMRRRKSRNECEDLTIDSTHSHRHFDRKMSSTSSKKFKYSEESVSGGASSGAAAGGAEDRLDRDEKSVRRHSHSKSHTRVTDDDADIDKDHRRHHHHNRRKYRCRRHSRKHSHHSSSKKRSLDNDDDEQTPPMMTGTATKILRDHSSYAEVTPLDSKEIYAEGDRIVINVNFKRDNNEQNELKRLSSQEECVVEKAALVQSAANSESKQETQNTPTQQTQNSTAQTVQRVSSQRDESVSPPPTTTTATATISRCDDNSNTSSTTRMSSGSRVMTVDNKMDTSSNTSDVNKKDRVVDELSFLPRSLRQSSELRPQSQSQSQVSVSSVSKDYITNTITSTNYGPHTPEGEYCEDQFMPTPTQDESQSPLRTRSSASASVTVSSSPTLSCEGKNDDVYDPEAPLQSPVDSINKLISSSPQKESSSLLSPQLSQKENAITKQSPVSSRRTLQTSVEMQSSKFNSPSAPNKELISIPKSSPVTTSLSSVHYSSSRRSPFKSPSLAPQRQLSQISPQKPSPQKSLATNAMNVMTSIATSLMPPPNVTNVTSRGPSSAVTSSMAMTAAAIASINPTNLAQLLQMAQSLKNPQHQLLQLQQRSATATSSSSSINSNHQQQHQTHASANRDVNEVIDMDVESPSPPQISSSTTSSSSNRVSSTTSATATVQTLWDQILKSTQNVSKSSSNMLATKRLPSSSSKVDHKKGRHDHSSTTTSGNKHHQHHHRSHHQIVNVTDNKKHPLHSGANDGNISNKLDQLTVLDDVPSSAVEMAVKEKFIKKLNRQERVIEEVKLVLKPHYQKRQVSKEEYKEILRKSVPKICHSRSGEINPVKIKSLIEGYIKRFKYLRKKSKK